MGPLGGGLPRGQCSSQQTAGRGLDSKWTAGLKYTGMVQDCSGSQGTPRAGGKERRKRNAFNETATVSPTVATPPDCPVFVPHRFIIGLAEAGRKCAVVCVPAYVAVDSKHPLGERFPPPHLKNYREGKGQFQIAPKSQLVARMTLGVGSCRPLNEMGWFPVNLGRVNLGVGIRPPMLFK